MRKMTRSFQNFLVRSTCCIKHQQISTNITKYEQISTNINKYQQISTNINKYQPISTNIIKYQCFRSKSRQIRSHFRNFRFRSSSLSAFDHFAHMLAKVRLRLGNLLGNERFSMIFLYSKKIPKKY